jgi:flagellar motor switch protein FliN/FliY
MRYSATGLTRTDQAELGAAKQVRESHPGPGDASPEFAGSPAFRRQNGGPLASEPDAGSPLALRLSPAIERLPVEMAVAIPVRKFRVRDLLAMVPGVVIETQWTPGEDLPLSAGEVQLAWSEFEVVDTQLAVRVTRLG